MVSYGLASAFALFALAALFTPGPNNVMLMTSGLNFGMARTVPIMLGVASGFGAMVAIVGLGFGAVFSAYPAIYTAIKYLGAAYLLYLAWSIARSGSVKEGVTRGRPFRFMEAVAFQWVNPKGWVMCVGAVTTYAAITAYPYNIIIMATFFGVFGLASSWLWTMFGTVLRPLVTNPRSVRIFNMSMALLLVLSLLPVFAEDWI
jgi:threonine/homoserine/homoserine lactone efflux protein